MDNNIGQNNASDYGGIYDDEYDEAIDNDFDALSSPPPQTNRAPRTSNYAGSLMGEYNFMIGDDDEDEIDDFDFEARVNFYFIAHLKIK